MTDQIWKWWLKKKVFEYSSTFQYSADKEKLLHRSKSPSFVIARHVRSHPQHCSKTQKWWASPFFSTLYPAVYSRAWVASLSFVTGVKIIPFCLIRYLVIISYIHLAAIVVIWNLNTALKEITLITKSHPMCDKLRVFRVNCVDGNG